ncbi:hypothetical protein PsYK624_061500 [Phanerochaete sordida]|uniref:F-box domain-containing protein n=1 Tax=Phanerochaete sordida TaxID=48140 RepID=A0A9P3G902_9APHY|nr:hypothetical protein PsYK624_061500 [Phanerochaete sordida]
MGERLNDRGRVQEHCCRKIHCRRGVGGAPHVRAPEAERHNLRSLRDAGHPPVSLSLPTLTPRTATSCSLEVSVRDVPRPAEDSGILPSLSDPTASFGAPQFFAIVLKMDPLDATTAPKSFGSFASQVDVDSAIRLEEARIAEIQKSIIRLRRERNTFATACRLPPELLGEIFIYVVQLWNDIYCSKRGAFSRRKSPFRINERHWTNVSEVCHHWHDIFTHNPRVWGYIVLDGSHTADAKLAIARSGQVPLHITQVDSGHMASTLLILRNMYRIRILSSIIDDDFSRVSVAKSLPLDAPLLQELDLKATARMGETSFSCFANASWPRLSSLTCRHLKPELFRAVLRPTLTSLTVSGVANGFIPTILAWVEILRKLPALQVLKLTGVVTLPGNTVEWPGKDMQVKLPCLKSVTISDEIGGVPSAFMLTHLVIPADAHKHLASHVDGGPNSHLAFWTSLAQKTSVIGKTKPARIVEIDSMGNVAEDGVTGVIFNIYTDDASLFSETPHGRKVTRYTKVAEVPALRVYLRGQPHEMLNAFVALYPLSEVHGLSLSYVSIADGYFWRRIAALPRLRELGLMAAEDTLRIFLHQLRAPSVFPALEWLELASFTWNKRHATRWKRRTRLNALVLPLIGALEARKQQGRAVKMLALPVASNVYTRDRFEGDAARLRALVEEFSYSPEEKIDCDSCEESEEEGDEIPVDDEDDLTTDEEEAGEDEVDNSVEADSDEEMDDADV